MTTQMIYLLAIPALYVLWNLVPHLVTWCLKVPLKHKFLSSLCWIKITVLSLVSLIPNILAFVVVPLALLFTKREADRLPILFRLWDNDVSINGDRVEDWALDFNENAYYAKAPPRSFWARYVWLVWRNRCSWLSQYLGYTYKPGEFESRTIWGNDHTSRTWPDGEGWVLRKAGPVYQMMVIKHITSKLCIRIHWGNKLFDRTRAPIVNISFSILSWRVEY